MIAITGIGILSAAGIGKEELLQSFVAVRSGISEAAGFGLPCNGIVRLGAVRNFSAKDIIPAIKVRRMSRFSRLALASAVEAVQDAGIEVTDRNRYRIAIALGTGLASTDSTDRFYEGLLREGPEATNPMIFPETVQNIAASHISMHFMTRGPNITFSHADISSELALMFGAELLKDGQADAVIVTGADELSISAVIGYSSLGVVSNEMKPFDSGRKGFVLGEGGATVILERLDDARKRNARVYCTVEAVEIASHPSPNLAYDRSRLSLKRALQTSLAAADLTVPGFVSASANATPDLDGLEADTLSETVGSSVPVTAYRSYHGYFPGDGILRLASAALCMDRGILPAIAGLDQPFEKCKLDLIVGSPRKLQKESALLSTLSTGGSAAGIVLKKGL